MNLSRENESLKHELERNVHMHDVRSRSQIKKVSSIGVYENHEEYQVYTIIMYKYKFW